MTPDIMTREIEGLQERAAESLAQLVPIMEETFRDMAITIQYRVKTKESIFEKCERKDLQPEELKDLLGIRIIGKTKDFAKILRKVFENFEVRQIQDYWFHTTELGYRSFHVLISVEGFLVEMQIHTAMSSAFALLCHDFYKNCNDKDCSEEILRALKAILESEAREINCEHAMLIRNCGGVLYG